MKLTAATTVRCDVDTLWARTQDPREHARWDLRFTSIEPEHRRGDGPLRFRYRTRLGPWMGIEGWGETVASRASRGSSLRFGSRNRRCPIREGSGCWVYDGAGPDRVRFWTVYDYRVRWGWPGRVLDRVILRPAMVWATRWSFDRLRLWVERGLAPAVALRLWLAKLAARTFLGLVWCIEGVVPKMLLVRDDELALVEASGLWMGSPRLALGALGIAELVGGLWLLWGRAERVAVAAATVVAWLLAAVVLLEEPMAVAGPYGGVIKNLGLVGCAAVVWLLAPFAPQAARARLRQGDRP